MKAIAKPPHRLRTDVNFAPPGGYQLEPTRFVDVHRDFTPLYSPDEADRRFIERCEAVRLCDPPLTLQALCALMAALEVSAFREIKSFLQKHQQKQRETENNKTATSATTAAGGATAATTGVGGGPAGQQPAHHHFSSAVSMMTASNRDALMSVRIADIPDVLRRQSSAGDDDSSASSSAVHPIAKLPATSAVIKKVHDAVHGHWVEKRCALGTALCPQFRLSPIDGGPLTNSVVGDDDDPFVDREISDVLVVWRESPAHTFHTKTTNQQQQQSTSSSGTKMTKTAQKALKKELKQLTNTAESDRATLRRLLSTARALMEAVVQREELRLEHAEATIAELALARRCRQLPASALQMANTVASGAATPALSGSSGGTKKGREQQQAALLAAQFQASQQLVPLVSQNANAALSAPLQPAQLKSVVDELSSRFGLI